MGPWGHIDDVIFTAFWIYLTYLINVRFDPDWQNNKLALTEIIPILINY